MRLSSEVRSGALVLAALVLTAAAPASASASAEPVFGPVPFVKTLPGPQVFTETFASPAAGPYVLWVHNGDDGGRVPAATIAVNGVVLVSESDFRRPVERFWRTVGLLAGENTLTVQLKGDPGGYLTLAILPASARPDLVVGRLVLPWGARDPQLVLAFKNGSHAARRFVKVSFYDPAGELVATSDRFALDPRASRSSPVADLISSGSWTEGSIEIFYAGADGSRLFATAAVIEPETATPAVLVLPHAGVRHHLNARPGWTTQSR
jgi:hypothetical protein